VLARPETVVGGGGAAGDMRRDSTRVGGLEHRSEEGFGEKKPRSKAEPYTFDVRLTV
jgi:hypothetical protein